MAVIKTIRKIIAFVPLLIGILAYYIAEFIAGEKFTWRADLVERNTIFRHNYHMQNVAVRNSAKRGPRTQPKKRKK